MNKFKEIEDNLEYLKNNHLYRTMKVFESAQSTHVMVDEKDFLMLSSNSYLDLCNNNEIKDYVKKVVDEYGCGSGGSRLTTGTSEIHYKLEEAIAKFKQCESAIVFNTGYMANVGTISAICNEEYTIFSDELNHASIIDGCRLSKAKTIVYKHNDMEDLERKIKESGYKKGLIVSDSVFSMDGDIVNLPKLVEIADKYELISMIDDAHGTGVLGENGRGTAEYYNIEGRVDIIVGTLSKAIGSEGGFVCASKKVIEYLRNKARSFIFSTALAPSTVAASLKAFNILERDSIYTEKLQNNIRIFCEKLNNNNIECRSDTAIIPIIIGDEEKTLKISQKLLEEGIYVSAIRYPTVYKGKARLRITLMANHKPKELEMAAKKIAETIRIYS